MGTGETFFVTLIGGAPWGFRLQGGGGHPLQVSRVRKKGKAHMKDLREGDVVLSINGIPVEGKTHQIAMEYVDNASNEIVLEILRGGVKQQTPQQAPQPYQQQAVVRMQPMTAPSDPRTHTSSSAYTIADDNSRTDVKTQSFQHVSDDGSRKQFVRQQQVTTVNQGKWGPSVQPKPPRTAPQPYQPLPKPAQPQVNVSAMFRESTDDMKENVAPRQFGGQHPPSGPAFQVKDFSGKSTVNKPGMWSPSDGPVSTTTTRQSTTIQSQTFDDGVQTSHKAITLQDLQKGRVKPGYGANFGPLWKKEEKDTEEVVVDVTPRDISEKDESKLHVFGPPVQISLTPPDSLPVEPEAIVEDMASPESSILGKKKMFSDSAFYDDPDAAYPTIADQMKLCKQIALSLTSNANKKARGARMFAKRKKFSPKWVHEGSSAHEGSSEGDVGDINDLDSELSVFEGGTKPLFAFRIPKVKTQIGIPDPPKMTLTPDQFEKMRLTAKRCEHRTVSPNTCFSLVEDLHSAKGRGAKLFEKRLRKSEGWVVDETNVPSPPVKLDKKKLEDILKFPQSSGLSPWEAALDNPLGMVDAAFEHLDSYERMKKLNKNLVNICKTDEVPTLPGPVDKQASLIADSQLELLKGPNFNRTARGWVSMGSDVPIESLLPQATPEPPPPTAPKPKVQQGRDFNPRMKGFTPSETASPTPSQQERLQQEAMYSSTTSITSNESELANLARNGAYQGYSPQPQYGGPNFSPHQGGFYPGAQQQQISLPGSDL